MEFGLLYANDWFMLLLTVKAGRTVRVKAMTVAKVFGECILEPTGLTIGTVGICSP